jgi:Zyg-11 protein homolog
MENHLEEQVMVRNCCLSLCQVRILNLFKYMIFIDNFQIQFDIPQEILFNYGRVANLLVRVLEAHNSDALTQRIVVFLLNSMACHVEGEQKIEVGEIGAIEVRSYSIPVYSHN